MARIRPFPLLVALLAAPAPALAEPSTICSGSCAGAPETVCGEAADCAGQDCLFADACLPGGAFAVARVVPEAETGLNDFAAWRLEGTPAVVVEDGALTARLPEGQLNQYFARDLALRPGTRYALRARMRRDPDAYGYLAGYLDDGSVAYADPPGADGDWHEVSVFLDGANASGVTIAFFGVHAGQADEGGAVQVRDLALLELAEGYGQYWRVTLEEPAVDASFAAPYVILIGGPRFYDSLAPEPLRAGAPGPWIDMRARLPGTFATFGLVFTDGAGARLAPVRVKLELAYRPDEAAVVLEREMESANGGVGLVGSGAANPLHFASRLRLISELVGDDPALFRARPGFAPAPQPVHFASLSSTGWLPDWGPPESLAPVFDFWRDLGLNGVYELASPELEPIADAAGVSFRYTSIGPPSTWLAPGAPYDLEALGPALEVQWENDPVVRERFAAFAGAPDRLLVDMCDEAYGFYFAGDPTYHQGFREYVQAECPGCTPESFGKARWEDLFALTEADRAAGLDAARPDPSDLAAARLFYWQMRWWSEATSRVYAMSKDFLVDKFGGERPPIISPQLGTPFGGYYSWRGGLEMQTLLRAGAMTGFHGEAFVGWNDWCDAQHISLYADWIDGQLAGHDIDRRASHVHFTRGSGAQKAVGLAARGITMLSWYTYGPHQLTTGDGMAGLGEASLGPLKIVQDGSRALALAEPTLAGARPVHGPVAMVAAQSDPLWWSASEDLWGYTSPVAADEIGVYLALRHGHHPVRFLVEDRLATDLGRDTQVLFLQRKHLSEDAFQAIRAWVEAGGTLVLVGELPTHDELGQPAGRDAWLGGELEPRVVGFDTYTVTWAGGPTVASAYPRRRVHGGPVLASYGDGGAAAVELARGAGEVRVVGFSLGHEYLSHAPACTIGLPGELGSFPGYLPEVREALLSLVGDVARPAWASEPLVELVRLTRPDGEALVLLNYSNAAVPALTVDAPDLAGRRGPARFAGREVSFDAAGRLTLALGDVEVIGPLAPVTSGAEAGGCGCRASGRGGAPAWPIHVLAGTSALLPRRSRHVRRPFWFHSP